MKYPKRVVLNFENPDQAKSWLEWYTEYGQNRYIEHFEGDPDLAAQIEVDREYQTIEHHN